MTNISKDKTIRLSEEDFTKLKTQGVISLKDIKGITVGTETCFEGYDSKDVLCVRLIGVVKKMTYNTEYNLYELSIKISYTEELSYTTGGISYNRTHYLELTFPHFRRAEESKSLGSISVNHLYRPNDSVIIREYKNGKLTKNELKAKIVSISMNGKGTIKAILE